MPYELAFLAPALKEWEKLDVNTREQFKKKLSERLIEPRVPSAKLRGARDRYKIKLRTLGYRLVYEVRDGELIVLVVAVGNATETPSTKRRLVASRNNPASTTDDRARYPNRMIPCPSSSISISPMRSPRRTSLSVEVRIRSRSRRA